MKCKDPCPICQEPLELEINERLIELTESEVIICNRIKDHIFIAQTSNQQPQIIKIKFNEDGKKLFLKLDFQNEEAFLWTKPNDLRPRRIPLFSPDYSNIPRLKQKLKTLLLFV